MQYLTMGGMVLDNVAAADERVYPHRWGGNALHSAIAARIWSDEVGLACYAPERYGYAWLPALRQAGLNTDCVSIEKYPIAYLQWLLYGRDGSRREGIYAPWELFRGLRPGTRVLGVRQYLQRISVPAGTEGTTAAFRSRYSLDISLLPASFPKAVHIAPSPPSHLPALVRALKAKGTMVTFDPFDDIGQWPASLVSTLLSLVDVFLPSEAEVEALLPGLPRAEQLQRLEGYGCHVAIKQGSKGCTVWNADRCRWTEVPGVDADVVDPTGAGDSFCGAFLTAYAETCDPVRAAVAGNVTAAALLHASGVQNRLGIAKHSTLQQKVRERLRVQTGLLAPEDGAPPEADPRRPGMT